MVIKKIKLGFRILSNPEKEFSQLGKFTFEQVLGYYMLLLLTVAAAAGSFNFLFSLGKAVYYNLTLSIDIQYMRMINYTIGRSFSIIFLYLFAGTFLLFFIIIALKIFFRKISYTNLLKIIFYSATPLLMLSWLPSSKIATGIWSIILFMCGVRSFKSDSPKKGSIRQRE